MATRNSSAALNRRRGRCARGGESNEHTEKRKGSLIISFAFPVFRAFHGSVCCQRAILCLLECKPTAVASKPRTTDVDMKQLLILLVPVLWLSGCHSSAKDPAATFYLQLVRGSDIDKAPTSDSKPIGQKLRKKLQCAFKWKHYWEIKRDTVTVPLGHKVRQNMGSDQAVELELLSAEKVAVRIYSGGQLLRCREQPTTGAFCISGGHSGENQSWFIVVRRDQPDAPRL